MRENIKTGIKYLALFGMCFLGGRSLAAGQTVRVDGEKPCRLAILIDDFGIKLLVLPIVGSSHQS